MRRTTPEGDGQLEWQFRCAMALVVSPSWRSDVSWPFGWVQRSAASSASSNPASRRAAMLKGGRSL
ncbi:MAG: hypothetical protein ACOVKF_07935, partial [Limnohabitans sp.]